PRIRSGSGGAGSTGDRIRLYPAAVGAKRSRRWRPAELSGQSARAPMEQGRASGANDGRPRRRSEVIALDAKDAKGQTRLSQGAPFAPRGQPRLSRFARPTPRPWNATVAGA